MPLKIFQMVVFLFLICYTSEQGGMNMSELGERLYIARKAAGLTQEELGKSIGSTGVAIMRY